MILAETQLKQIIQEEIEKNLHEWEPGTVLSAEQPASGEFPRPFSEEPPETTDLADFSPSEAFGMAWTKAIEFLDAAGMGDAARYLEKQSSPDPGEAV